MGEIDGKARVSEESGNAVFDASQYDFFGKHVLEEVELGGLEDDSDDYGLVDDDDDDDDKDYQSFYNKSSEEGEGIDLPDIDDISSTFSKLNRTVSEPQSTLKVGGSDSFPKQSFHNADWVQQSSFSNFQDQSVLNTENVFNTQQWPSQQHPFPVDPKPLNRTTSYPHQPIPNQQPHIGSKPVPVPKPALSSYMFPLPPNQSQFSPPNQSQFSPPIHIPHSLQQFQHENIPQQFGPSGLPINIRQQIHPHFQNQPGPVLHNSGPLNPRFNQMRPHLYHPRPPNQMTGLRSFHRPLFRSKYMSPDEIDNIIRIQHIATHSNDPYTDDYYHQACLAKKSLLSNSRPIRLFCPNSITESSTRTKANSEPHAFLQVEALGRLPFSSIRRPRPLLELDPKSDTHNEKTIKPLEQETMLAARIAIEDGLSLLLDIDDVDRFLQFNPAQDGGSHLRQKRQNLLEGIATSLQLVDPLSHTITHKDDLVFLRIVSLPKGRKFISRYIKLLRPNDEVVRIVCMAVFRHLRFLFGETPSDSSAAKATTDLMAAVTWVVSRMELNAVSACLAAVVCSSEQPPLRPIGNSAGDCASVAVKALLDRGTELLTDQRAAAMVSYVVRNVWQESFNAFFGMLTKYCVAKFESLTGAAQVAGGEVAQAVTREMPVELLRASLPHTDEAQRRLLREFAQRSMPLMNNHASSGNGPANSESVRS